MKSFRQFLNEERVNPETFNIGYMFTELNRTIFDNELPGSISVSFGKCARGTTGETRYQIRAKRMGGRIFDRETIPESVVIVIQPRAYEEEKLRGILAHEMIHALLALRNTHESNQHGPVFMATLRKLQAKASFTIPITDASEAEEYSDKDYRRTTLVFRGKADGTVSFGSFSKNADMTPAKVDVEDSVARGYLKWALVVQADNILDVPAQRGYKAYGNSWWVWKEDAAKKMRNISVIAAYDVPRDFMDAIGG